MMVRPTFAVVMTVCLLFQLTGCGGGDGRPDTESVGGSVNFDGKPLAHGTMILEPEKGRSAQATIKDGKIESVTTFEPGDGAIAGSHKVAIQSLEANPSDPMAAKSLIPAKYGSIETSGLTAEIKPGEPNDLKFDLTP